MVKRLLLADDDAMVRGLVRQFLSARTGWQICAEASDGLEAVALAKLFAPDLAILDIAMPKQNGLDAGREIIEQHYSPAVLALTLYDPSFISSQAAAAGIHGIVSKTSIGSELIPAIERLLEGGTYFKALEVPGVPQHTAANGIEA